MAKHDELKKEEAEVKTKETKRVAVTTEPTTVEGPVAVANDVVVLKQLEAQHKMQIVLAVLVGVAFVWLAFISARMYATSLDYNQGRIMMNRTSPWGSSNGNGMMDNGSGFEFR